MGVGGGKLGSTEDTGMPLLRVTPTPDVRAPCLVSSGRLRGATSPNFLMAGPAAP